MAVITRRSTRFGLFAGMALLLACNGDNGGSSGGAGGAGGGSGGTTVATTSSAAGAGGASLTTTAGSGGSSGGSTVAAGGSNKGGASGGAGAGGFAAGGASGGPSATGGGGGPRQGGQSGRERDASQAGAGGGGAPDGGAGSGQDTRGGADGASTIDSGSTSTGCASPLPAVTDYAALAGPFATTTETKTGPDGQCVIYRPKTLGENGFLHAPIVFGPGIDMQASQLSGLLLSFASHGYVVIGTGVLKGGPNDPNNKAAMQNALEWLIKQNGQAGTFQGKLATKCAVAMGYSVGGTAAVEIGGHEAVATVVSIHGHTATAALHGTMLQTSGDKDTVGRPMQQKTFDQSRVPTAFGTVSGADHGYIQKDNGGVERTAIIAWMRYWINGDTGARKYFWGSDCVLCKSPWMDYKTKNWQ